MIEFILRVLGVFLVSALTGLAAHAVGPGAELAPIFAGFGSVSFFLGPYADMAGFFVQGIFVDSETPGCVWKAFGIMLWIVAAVILLYALFHRGG